MVAEAGKVERDNESESGPPIAVIKGDDGIADQTALVSISHDGKYAVAVCLGFEPAKL